MASYNFHDKKSFTLIPTVNESTHHFALIDYLNDNNTAKMILSQLLYFSTVCAGSKDITDLLSSFIKLGVKTMHTISLLTSFFSKLPCKCFENQTDD